MMNELYSSFARLKTANRLFIFFLEIVHFYQFDFACNKVFTKKVVFSNNLILPVAKSSY